MYPVKLSGNPIISAQIKHMCAERGVISFAQFMDICLHHPQQGYYRRSSSLLKGKGKDFATCMTLSTLLPDCVAQWILHQHNTGSSSSQLPIIELGGGTGHLAATILERLTTQGFDSSYVMVEVNTGLVQMQQSMVSWYPDVRWCSTIHDALEQCQGRAIIICNEFVDIFPVRVMKRHGSCWQELFLSMDNDLLVEVMKEPFPAVCSREWLASVSIDSSLPGQRIELHSSFLDWWARWDPLFKQGKWLIIDYGDVFPGLYKRKPEGTVRAYFRNTLQSGPDVYQRLGHQDITADVNFSELFHAAVMLDWKYEELLDQHEFIKSFRSEPAIQKSSHVSGVPKSKYSDQFVLDPTGAGSSYKVAILSK